jgi:hypothetical protein
VLLGGIIGSGVVLGVTHYATTNQKPDLQIKKTGFPRFFYL